MPLRRENLPNDPEALKSLALHLAGENDLLRESLRLLRARLYHPQSERILWDGNIEELFLFTEMEQPAEEAPEKEKTPTVPVGAHQRKKAGRRPLPEDLPRVVNVIDIPDEEKLCPRGHVRPRIGEEVSEKLDVIPPRAQVIRTIRPKYGPCSCADEPCSCEDGTIGTPSPSVAIAPVPPQILPKSIASPGLLAFILTAKFVDSIPFYRQEKQFERMGVDLGRATMASWGIKVAELCAHLMVHLRKEVLAGPWVGVDETTLQVLKEPGRSATTDSYLWLFRGGLPGRATLFYFYSPSREGSVAAVFLKGYQGGVETDGFSGYDWLDYVEGIVHLGCWAHVRRNFVDVLKATGKALSELKGTIAGEAVDRIKELYEIERYGREENLSPEALGQLRQEKAKPLLTSLHSWLKRKKPAVPPRSLVGNAIGYALNQWPRLERYVEDGAFPIDNNPTENGIRPFVVGRKNWLFSDTVNGARATATLYSLVETAKANGLDPYWYFRCLFERLPLASTPEDYQALIPQNIDRDWIAKAKAAAEA